MQKNKYILFDFDGVIADSLKPAYKVYRSLHPHVTEEAWKRQFEGNVFDYILPEEEHTPECRLDIPWFEAYLPVMKSEVDIFPGMRDVICELEKDYKLVIISSTLSFPIEEFLDSHDLRSHFDWVMGSDVHKSKVEKIGMVFEKYGATSEDCVFITDTLGDLREAEKMNVESIAVSWGFNSVETLRKGKHVTVVEKPEEVVAAVNNFFSQELPK
jgi:phosphoglycolate phosphatase-like HAD superfamily hydrolase